MKSTILSTLENIIGKKNVSNTPLQLLSYDKFAPAYLFGKMANICADLSTTGLRNISVFLQIVGGDSLGVQKKHGHYFEFQPNAKLIFSCNQIPEVERKEDEFYKRWIPLVFNKKHKVVDKTLKNKLLVELPGIFNWAIEGLLRLEKQGHFTYDPDVSEIRDFYERNSDSISSFIYNCIDTQDDLVSETKRNVYNNYLEFCKKNKLTAKNQTLFGTKFREVTGCGSCQKDKIPSYQGIKIKGGMVQDTLS